jgi:hypothetical protein
MVPLRISRAAARNDEIAGRAQWRPRAGAAHDLVRAITSAKPMQIAAIRATTRAWTLARSGHELVDRRRGLDDAENETQLTGASEGGRWLPVAVRCGAVRGASRGALNER